MKVNLPNFVNSMYMVNMKKHPTKVEMKPLALEASQEGSKFSPCYPNPKLDQG